MGPMLFKIFTTMPFSVVTQKLKTGKRSSLYLVFKYPKMRNVTQTLLNEIPY